MKEIYTFSHINRLDDDMPLSCSSQLQLVCCFTFIFLMSNVSLWEPLLFKTLMDIRAGAGTSAMNYFDTPPIFNLRYCCFSKHEG